MNDDVTEVSQRFKIGLRNSLIITVLGFWAPLIFLAAYFSNH